MCKRNAHPTGKDCPEDWELDQVLKMGDKAGWRRCYKCRNLVELVEGCTHMTCMCKAQFCYICGGVWDANIGCPNYCNGEEELERRRREEEAHLAEYEAEKAVQQAAAAADAAERLEAEQRTRDKDDFRNLAEMQSKEMERFIAFEVQAKEAMQSRHLERKQATMERHEEQVKKMKERHAKTVNQLEDRQVADEMDLRMTLEASERSVNIRLKHMQAYCDGHGHDSRSSSDGLTPRVVTERDLRELSQQYNLRDDMERLNQAKVNVMRDRQAKQMEDLVDRQEVEYDNHADKSRDELETLATEAAQDEETLAMTFAARRAKLVRRWELAIEILRQELGAQDGVRYAPISTPAWP